MQQKPLNLQQPAQQPVKSRLLYWITIGGFLFALIVAGVWSVMLLKSQIIETGFTTETTKRQFVLGNDVLNIPLNMMRFEQHRKSAALEQAELMMSWPKGTGYVRENASIFQNIDGKSDLIFITLSKRSMAHDMSGRLEPIYMKLFDGPSTEGPSGLRLQQLKTGSGYNGEKLAIYIGDGPLWVARCQVENQNTTQTCLRDIFVGNSLSLRYRFPARLLSNWREIEAKVLTTVNGFLAR